MNITFRIFLSSEEPGVCLSSMDIWELYSSNQTLWALWIKKIDMDSSI